MSAGTILEEYGRTHAELLQEIQANERRTCNFANNDQTCASLHPLAGALEAVVELHFAYEFTRAYKPICKECQLFYPCPTIQAIEKALS